jgi:hypothetical protein
VEERGFLLGDRVEYIGPDHGPNTGMPRPGERGTIIHLSPYDDAVAWDVVGTVTGALESFPVRRVEDDPLREPRPVVS